MQADMLFKAELTEDKLAQNMLDINNPLDLKF
jgi:hypothetical protein